LLYQLVGFFDPFENALAQVRKEYPEARLYESVEALLGDPSLELILVATMPHRAHAEHAIQVCKAGKHCVVIKPFAYTAKEADAMIAAAADKKVLLSSLQNVRWSLDFLETLWVLQNHEFGELRLIDSRPPGPSDHNPSDLIYTFGSHYLDQVLLLAESYPVEIAATFMHPTGEENTQGSYHVQMRMANGVMVVCSQFPPTRGSGGRTDLLPRFQVVGTKAHYLCGVQDQFTDLTRSNQYYATNEKGHQPFFTIQRPPFLQYRWKIPTFWEDFYCSLREGAPLQIPPEHTRQVAKIYEGATLSAKEKRTVQLTNDGPNPFPRMDLSRRVELPWENNFPF
jgi:predicted dehydrogenase